MRKEALAAASGITDDAVLRDFDTTDALKKAPGFAGAR